MSAFSACPPVQNTSAEGLQDQGAPPMRSANENPPPTPSLNRWTTPPPPPLERCAPTADEFQGVSPMAEVGGGTGMSSVHIHNMGAMGPLTQGPASAASLPFFCPPSFQNVVNRTSVYPQQFASSGGQGCFFPPTFPPSQAYCGCPGYCVQGSMPQVNQGQFCQKPVWQPLPQQNKFFPSTAQEPCASNWSQGRSMLSGLDSRRGPMSHSNVQRNQEKSDADSSSRKRTTVNNCNASQCSQSPEHSAGQQHTAANAAFDSTDNRESPQSCPHQHTTEHAQVDPSAQKNNGKSSASVPQEPKETIHDGQPVPEHQQSAAAHSKSRSAHEARANSNMSNAQIIPGFPEGPLPGARSDLKHRVNAFTTSVKTGGGAFTMVIASEPRVAKNRGVRQKLVCGQHKKMDCRFHVTYEETVQGWVLVNYHPHTSTGTNEPTRNHHSHELVQSEVEAMAARPRCEIPKIPRGNSRNSPPTAAGAGITAV